MCRSVRGATHRCGPAGFEAHKKRLPDSELKQKLFQFLDLGSQGFKMEDVKIRRENGNIKYLAKQPGPFGSRMSGSIPNRWE